MSKNKSPRKEDKDAAKKIFHSSTMAKQQRIKEMQPLAMTRYEIGKGNTLEDVYTHPNTN